MIPLDRQDGRDLVPETDRDRAAPAAFQAGREAAEQAALEAPAAAALTAAVGLAEETAAAVAASEENVKLFNKRVASSVNAARFSFSVML